MAESQEKFSYDGDVLRELRTAVSASRLRPYLDFTNGAEIPALQLYLWNARLAKSLLFPLQAVEVSMRNAINEVFGIIFRDADWILNPPSGFLSEKSEQSRLSGVERFKQNKKVDPNSNDLVAVLSFDFWSNLFRDEYSSHLSEETIEKIFPNMRPPFNWRYIQVRARRVNALRNRIAHHEPIWSSSDLRADYDRCLEIIGLINSDKLKWVRSHSTFIQAYRSRPGDALSLGGLSLNTFTFESPIILNGDESYTEVADILYRSKNGIAIIKDEEGFRVVSRDEILQNIFSISKNADGYVDLNEKIHLDIMDFKKVEVIRNDYGTKDVLDIFFPKGSKKDRPSYVLVKSPLNDDDIIGVISRPVIRYS